MILNMTGNEWDKLDKVYGKGEDFETSPHEFLEKIGLPCGLSVYYDTIETDFFEEIYNIWRKQRGLK